MRKKQNRGFTLIEILVVIGMLAILSTAVLIAVNPLRQFAEARNTQRENDVAAVLNAVSERIADNGGQFYPTIGGTDSCSTNLPNTATDISNTGADIRSCLVSTYISELPADPHDGKTCSGVGCPSGYDSQYTIMQDPSTSRITVCAPEAAESAVAGSKAFCLTR